MTEVEQLRTKAEKAETAIAAALKALDEGRMGDVRRILKTGSDKALLSTSGVIARNGPR